MDTIPMLVRAWFWHCPDCGTGHRQAGFLLPEPDLHCEFCLAEDGRHIRLRCWPAEQDHTDPRGEPAK